MTSPIEIHAVSKADNPAVAKLIRRVLVAEGAPKTGTAYEDKATDEMFETYNHPRSNYFLMSAGDRLIGGAGIAPLTGAKAEICELQKMYFLPEGRGRGLGQKMMNHCLRFAKEAGFTAVYIETLPSMKAAQKLYKRTGFQEIDQRLGNTGHYSCTVWLYYEL